VWTEKSASKVSKEPTAPSERRATKARRELPRKAIKVLPAREAIKDRAVPRVSRASPVPKAKTAAKASQDQKAVKARPAPTETLAETGLLERKGLMVPMEKLAKTVSTEAKVSLASAESMDRRVRKERMAPRALWVRKVFQESKVSLASQALKVLWAPLALQAKMEKMVKRATRDLTETVDSLGLMALLAPPAAKVTTDPLATKGKKEAKESKG